MSANLNSALDVYSESARDWLDDVVFSFRLARAARADLIAHDGEDWPNHIVYANSQGYGMRHADKWQEHEAKIRQFLGAKRPDLYIDPNDPDPALRQNADKIADMLEQADKSVWSDIEGIVMTAPAWGAIVTKIEEVRPHGENLSIVKTQEGNEVIANKKEDGSFRWAAGEACVYVPEGAIIPDDVLQERGYWDEEKGKGLLEGKKGNRVKMRRMAGFESRGLLFKMDDINLGLMTTLYRLKRGLTHSEALRIGDNVTNFFGITEHQAQ